MKITILPLFFLALFTSTSTAALVQQQQPLLLKYHNEKAPSSSISSPHKTSTFFRISPLQNDFLSPFCTISIFKNTVAKYIYNQSFHNFPKNSIPHMKKKIWRFLFSFPSLFLLYAPTGYSYQFVFLFWSLKILICSPIFSSSIIRGNPHQRRSCREREKDALVGGLLNSSSRSLPQHQPTKLRKHLEEQRRQLQELQHRLLHGALPGPPGHR